MDYKLKTIEIKNKKVLVMNIDNRKYQKVVSLLQSDVVADFEWYKKSLCSVLNGEQKKILGVGNLYEIEITPEYTYIYDTLTDDDEYCAVDTNDLYNTIANWERDYNSFIESQYTLHSCDFSHELSGDDYNR